MAARPPDPVRPPEAAQEGLVCTGACRGHCPSCQARRLAVWRPEAGPAGPPSSR